jgi:hypothetical protein
MFSIEQTSQGDWLLIGPLGTVVARGTYKAMADRMNERNAMFEPLPEVIRAIHFRTVAQHDLVLWRAVRYNPVDFLRALENVHA